MGRLRSPTKIIRLYGLLTLIKCTIENSLRSALKMLYKDDLTELDNRTLRGQKENIHRKKDGCIVERQSKEPLTPKKVAVINTCFQKRISSLGASQKPRGSQANFNQLIANSLNAIQREKWSVFYFICFMNILFLYSYLVRQICFDFEILSIYFVSNCNNIYNYRFT